MPHRPTVLIVEDEFLIAISASAVFERAGFDTVEASNADEAIAVLKERDVDLIFTDIRMPGSMDGLRLARYVRDRWPPIKIMVTSGHHLIQNGDLPDGGVFLPKPYTDAAVIAAISQLDGGRVAALR
jgi:two-component system, response regulator PdtaR